METKDKKDNNKIVWFPGAEQESDKKEGMWKRLIRGGFDRHPAFVVLTVIILPVFLAVLGPFLGKNIGSTELTESYVMPYIYARSDYLANAPGTGTAAGNDADMILYPREEQMSAEYYEKACAVRSFFSCSKVAVSQVSDSALHLYSLERYEYSDLSYLTFVKGNEIRIYAVNSGNGTAEAGTLRFSVGLALSAQDLPQAQSVPWTDVDANAAAAGEGQAALQAERQSVNGGDGILVYSFNLSGWALEQMAKGGILALWADTAPGQSGNKISLGWLSMQNGEIIVDGGGLGDDGNKYTYYVYVDVPRGGDRDIPVKAVFNIQDRAAVDTVIIPSESCKMEYSMSYEVDGREMETERFSTVVEVPLYEPLAEYSVAEYMNENDIGHYIYRATDMELSRQIEFKPSRLMDKAE